jgi:hypothetical protein
MPTDSSSKKSRRGSSGKKEADKTVAAYLSTVAFKNKSAVMRRSAVKSALDIEYILNKIKTMKSLPEEDSQGGHDIVAALTNALMMVKATKKLLDDIAPLVAAYKRTETEDVDGDDEEEQEGGGGEADDEEEGGGDGDEVEEIPVPIPVPTPKKAVAAPKKPAASPKKPVDQESHSTVSEDDTDSAPPKKVLASKAGPKTGPTSSKAGKKKAPSSSSELEEVPRSSKKQKTSAKTGKKGKKADPSSSDVDIKGAGGAGWSSDEAGARLGKLANRDSSSSSE